MPGVGDGGVPKVTDAGAEPSNDQSASTFKPVGLIYPPPELRNIIDKTAQFVAKNGPQFESTIAENEMGNTKFNFLKPTDPYNPYYKSKISDFQKGESGPSRAEVRAATKAEEEAAKKDKEEIAKKAETRVKQASSLFPGHIEVTNIPKEKGPDAEFTIDHPYINPLDMDIIKLTAQFVAKNGRSFLAGLSSREQRNPQFDFLKPTHGLFIYFQALVDSYAKCLVPEPRRIEKLKRQVENKNATLDALISRWQWEKAEEEKKKHQQSTEEEERRNYNSVDWHDFVVVEVITFDEDEELPAPAPQPEDDDMEMEMDEDDTPAQEAEPTMKIRTDYVPQAAHGGAAKSAVTQVCPVCKKHIPIAEFNEHMRIELLDPKWKEQKERAQSKKASGLVGDDEISRHLGSFAGKRSDIFGADEVAIGESAGPSLPPAPGPPSGGASGAGDSGQSATSVWNAQQAAAAEAAKAAAAVDARNEEARKKEEADKQAQMQRFAQPPRPAFQPPAPYPPQRSAMQMPPPMGGLPYPPPPGAGFPGAPQPPPPAGQPPVPSGQPPLPPGHPPPPAAPPGGAIPGTDPHPRPPASEPPAKKQKTDEIDLIPETEFLEKLKAQYDVSVQIPSDADKEEWKFNGQTVTITVAGNDSISTVKDKLKELLGGMPTNKMQMKATGRPWFKDNSTLAFYNVDEKVTLQLTEKKRGGRKK